MLRKGDNIIYLRKDEEENILGKYCGFFPLAKSAQVTTRGLKWNLNKQSLKFGSFISSSNEFDFACNEQVNESDEFKRSLLNSVFIKTDEDLLWTMSIN